MSRQIIVGGCGPAGMMAAIAAARCGAQVTVLEGMEKPGKKLLLTGNGRCNLTNLDSGLPRKYRTVLDDPVLEKESVTEHIFRQFPVADTLDFFHSLGLLTTEKNGYVYPVTGQAGSVLELLLAEMRRLKIKLKFSEKIIQIKQSFPDAGGEGKWLVQTGTWNYSCDRLILCCGSRAAETTGSDGSGYLLAKQAGHTIAPVLPALTALNTGNRRFLASCAGVRCPAKVSIYSCPDGKNKTGIREKTWAGPAEKLQAEDSGELQITENGISGIVVFQVSRYAVLALNRGEKVQAVLDLLPELSAEELERYLIQTARRWSGSDVSVLTALSGLLPRKLLAAVLEDLKIRPGSPAANLTMAQTGQLVQKIKALKLSVSGSRSFSQCQVCTGGVPLSEVYPDTLESRKAAGLYFAGELLDVDGPCGGYNLQWAWSSGFAAGHAAALSS